MDEVRSFGNVTAEDLLARAEAIDAAARLADIPPPIADHEFTITQFAERRRVSRNFAERLLAEMVRAGQLECAPRMDTTTKRRATAFWVPR